MARTSAVNTIAISQNWHNVRVRMGDMQICHDALAIQQGRQNNFAYQYSQRCALATRKSLNTRTRATSFSSSAKTR